MPLRLHNGAILAPRNFHGIWNALQVCGNTMSFRMWSTILLHTPSSTANSRAVHRRSASNRKQGVKLCYSPHGIILYGYCPERHPCPPGKLELSYNMRYSKLHRHMLQAVPENIVVYYDFVPLQFITEERCSSFVNIVTHYSYECQCSTHCSRLTEYYHRWLH